MPRSSGRFINAATVLKFVGADFRVCSPRKQLALALKLDPTAFSESNLDQLYTQILSVFPSAVNIAKVLGIISVSHGGYREEMEDIFGTEEGELMLVLRGVSSLMKDENKECLNEGDISSLTWHMLHLVIICSIRVAQAHSKPIKRNMKTLLLYGALHSLCN